ncbi:secretion system protein E [Pokkaliibacter plantistimulans]|uniref:Secretion system protein E n=1 Tax=Pokkaliibacter plantistimulans TaxID=1635171 RepID=A0ABX5M3F4_9GAMM|nr:ATPase, T2SS/T4P/T4SS family [Pokkaliibacter plantistimulans]PXF32083.1 secretion system protein E [Pokkaliibacter plantistimulans]
MSLLETPIGTISKDEHDRWSTLLHYLKPIAHLLTDETVSEIMVNRYDRVYVERSGQLINVDSAFKSESSLQQLITQIANALRQKFDSDNPILDARFPNGARLCCSHPSVSPAGATMTIRCKTDKNLSLPDLVSYGALTDEMCAFLKERIEARDTLIVSGGTSSGKTTLLRACAEYIDKKERVITAEDTLELKLDEIIPCSIAHEAPKRLSNSGENISLASLIKMVLRERPDRVWVGEIRDAAAADAFLQMSNTGHSGGATSIHSNGPEDTLRRIQYMLASAGMVSYELARHQVTSGVQLLVHCERHPIHGRKVTDICTVENEVVKRVFYFDKLKGRHVVDM